MNYRMSKYDPKLRNIDGAFAGNEWTSYGDIVEENKTDSYTQYKSIEDLYLKYIHSATLIGGVEEMVVQALEKKTYDGVNDRLSDCKVELLRTIKNGRRYSVDDLLHIARMNLREIIWCKFSYKETYIHFGYDYYVYIGGVVYSDEIIKTAMTEGIYLEEMDSPYLA